MITKSKRWNNKQIDNAVSGYKKYVKSLDNDEDRMNLYGEYSKKFGSKFEKKLDNAK